MAGEGLINALPPAWDQRPGALDAARIAPASGILVTGSRDARRHGGGWTVLCTVRGEDGTFCQVGLTPEDARKLGAELIDNAELLEGRIW